MPVEQQLDKLTAVAVTDVDLSGNWANELNPPSTMKVTQIGSNFTGDYKSYKSSQPGVPATGKVAGTVNGQQVAFIVRWDNFPSITAWVGEVVGNSNPLQVATLWQMTSREEPGDEWASITAGTDTFTKQP